MTPPDSPADTSRPTVVAVVVTFNRRGRVGATLDAIRAQNPPPAAVVVVDNGSSDGTADHLREHHPDVVVLTLARNEGFGAGLARGIEHVAARGLDPDYYWLSDDDSTPPPDHLAGMVARAELLQPGLGVLGDEGYVTVWAVPRRPDDPRVAPSRAPRLLDDTVRCDWTLVDGALVTREAVRRCGTFRDDLFMMCEDLDYTTRVSASGLTVATRITPRTARDHLGTAGGDHAAARPWRCYYQTRNQLLIALDRRSPRLVAAWAWRTVRFLVASVIRRRWAAVAMRLRGAADGLRGRTGITVSP